MNRQGIAAVFVIAGLALCTTTARGSGFGINEHSARAMGMAGAFTAVADTPAALFFNPAGIAQLNGLSAELGLTFIAPTATYNGMKPDGSGKIDVAGVAHKFYIPNLHLAYRIHDRVAVGLAVYVPYGLTSEWDSTVPDSSPPLAWWGRSVIKKIALQTFYINPTVAVKLHERVLLGLGVTIVPGNVSLERAIAFSNDIKDDIDFKMTGDDVGIGATAGVLVKVLPEMLNVGITYRSGVAMEFSGNATFTKDGTSAGVPAGLRTRLPDGEGTAVLNLPHTLSFGLAAFPIKGLTLAASVEMITWSDYDALVIDFKDGDELDVDEPKDWHNTVVVRVGGEYNIFDNPDKTLQRLGVRLGYIFDQGPIPADRIGPELPDSSRHLIGGGLGLKVWDLSIDVAYTYLWTGAFETGDLAPLVGTYEATAHLAALSLGYSFDI